MRRPLIFDGARAFEQPLKLLETRAKVMKSKQVHDLGPWVLRARPPGARALDGATDGVNSWVVRGNTCECIAPQHNHSGSSFLSESLILVDEGSVQLVSTDLVEDST